jgi:hypothetical protein
MYNCILWSGAGQPLPKMEDDVPDRHSNWRPLFASEGEMPLFWWILLDRFNGFWLDNGAPTFVVDRMGALLRAEKRMSRLDDIMSPHQRLAWHEFYAFLHGCEDDMLYIQLQGLWSETLQSDTERFNAYVRSFLLPLEGGNHGTRLQKEQKKLLLAELFSESDSNPVGLCGVSLFKKHTAPQNGVAVK